MRCSVSNPTCTTRLRSWERQEVNKPALLASNTSEPGAAKWESCSLHNLVGMTPPLPLCTFYCWNLPPLAGILGFRRIFFSFHAWWVVLREVCLVWLWLWSSMQMKRRSPDTAATVISASSRRSRQSCWHRVLIMAVPLAAMMESARVPFPGQFNCSITCVT